MSLTLKDLIATQVRSLAPVLHPGMAEGLLQADWRMAGYDRAEYGYMYSHHAKIGLREYASREDLGEWRLGGNSRLQGQTIFTLPKYEITMKVLKENRRIHPGGTPPSNGTRPDRLRYSDPRPRWETIDRPLDMELPATDQGAGIDLLLLWDHVTEIDAETGFSLRVVHTTSPGVFGRRVPTDLSYDIKAPDTVFVHSRFDGDAGDEDLYSYQVDAGEEKDAN